MNDINCWETKFEPCVYSDRLLGKLLRINEKIEPKINITEVKKAIYYAKKYHGTQTRQSGEPYYSHPLQVALYVSEYCFKTNILVTSILHDTLEDTALTEIMIKNLFNATVASQVEALTRVKIDGKISAAEIVKLLWLQKKQDLLLVKFFDRLHNMQTINSKSPEKILKTVKETLKEFMSLGLFLSSKFPSMHIREKQITYLCYQNIVLKQQPLELKLFLAGDNFQLPSLTAQSDLDRNNILY